MTGCASSTSTTSSFPSSSSPSRSSATASETWTPSDAAAQIRAAADNWEGTPHDLGGTSHRGVDCSGLVQSVYTERFDISVPRTTDQQVTTGRSVQRSALQPGDLVFFRPGWKKRHVGIYLSDGDFLHASSSQGVALSSLDNSYWTDHWWQARRLLPFSSEESDKRPSSAPSPSNASPSNSSPSNASSSPRASGW